MKKHISTVVSIALFVTITLFSITGCGEGEDPLESTEPLKSDGVVGPFGAMKKTRDAAPGAPQLLPEGTPTVTSVGYYSDWQLTEPLSGTVPPGTTFFVKVVFSEPMRFRAADDNTARPILYYRVGEQQVRFRVAEHGAVGEDFVSGDAKPLGNGTDDYICKYTVPADTTDKFRIEIGKFNADRDGNNLPKFYIHGAQLQLGQPVKQAEALGPLTVTFTFQNVTEQRSGTIRAHKVSAGETPHIKVVFSQPLEHIDQLSPKLSLTLNDEEVLEYRETGAAGFVSGTYRREGDNAYLCKYKTPTDTFGYLKMVVEIGNRVFESDNLHVFLQACPIEEAAEEIAGIGNKTGLVGHVFTPRGEGGGTHSPSPE